MIFFYLTIRIQISWCPCWSIITSASSSTNAFIFLRLNTFTLGLDQSNTVPGVPITICSWSSTCFWTWVPFIASIIWSPFMNWPIDLTTSAIWDASSIVGAKHNAFIYILCQECLEFKLFFTVIYLWVLKIGVDTTEHSQNECGRFSGSGLWLSD